jgi:hypothetical protein
MCFRANAPFVGTLARFAVPFTVPPEKASD